MKQGVVIVFLIAFIITAFYSVGFAGDRPRDFRGILWGTHISKIPGLVLKEEIRKIGEKIYVRPSDSLKIKYGEVAAIEYSFIKDKLTAVVLHLADYSQYDRVKSLFLSLYGPPDKEESERVDSVYKRHFAYWFGNKDNEADVVLRLDDIDGSLSGRAVMEWKASQKKDTGL